MTDDHIGKSREPVKLHAAGLLEQLYSPGTLGLLQQIYYLDAVSYRQIVLGRAQERLEGKNLTPIPDGSKIPAARVEELLNGLSTAKPEAASAAIQAWKIEDKVGYAIWRAKEENHGKIPASVVAAKLVILPVDSNETMIPPARMNETMQALEVKPGTLLSGDSLISLAAKLAPQAKERSGLVFNFSASRLGHGLDPQAIRVFDLTPEERTRVQSDILERASSSLEEKSGVVVISWSSPDGENSDNLAVWSLTDAGVEAPPAETLEKLCTEITKPSNPDSEPFEITLSVLHRDDSEKLESFWSANDSSDEDE